MFTPSFESCEFVHPAPSNSWHGLDSSNWVRQLRACLYPAFTYGGVRACSPVCVAGFLIKSARRYLVFFTQRADRKLAATESPFCLAAVHVASNETRVVIHRFLRHFDLLGGATGVIKSSYRPVFLLFSRIDIENTAESCVRTVRFEAGQKQGYIAVESFSFTAAM